MVLCREAIFNVTFCYYLINLFVLLLKYYKLKKYLINRTIIPCVVKDFSEEIPKFNACY